ncbi:hypothetical protein HDV01_000489 [Terramyces sp. JEL0728]|nr:hypothetical protein HDV01_000489 [Terramyces sp. JEL0728]
MLKLISQLENQAQDLEYEISELKTKGELNLPTVQIKDTKRINLFDKANEAFNSLQLQLDCLLPLLQQSGIIKEAIKEKSIEKVKSIEEPKEPKEPKFNKDNIESIGLSTLGLELISERFSSNSLSFSFEKSIEKLEPEYNLLDQNTRAKISLNYFNETVQEINELLEDKKFLGRQDGFTVKELQESSKQKKFNSRIKAQWINQRNLLTITTNTTTLYRLFEPVHTFPGSLSCSNNANLVVFDTCASFYDLESGKKVSEFEVERVLNCEWKQQNTNGRLIYATKDTVYLRLNQSLLIRQIKIESQKLDLFDNQLIIINDKIHLYSLNDLDFLLLYSKKKQLLDEQSHSLKILTSRFHTEMNLYEKQSNSLQDKLPLKTRLEWKKQVLYGQTKIDQKLYLPIQRNINSIYQKIVSIITEIMDLYYEIKNTIAEMSTLTKLKKLDKLVLVFTHDFQTILKSIKGKCDFLVYLTLGEINEMGSWFIEYDKNVEFSISQLDFLSDYEPKINIVNGTVYSYDDRLYMTKLDASMTALDIEPVVDLDWYNGLFLLTEKRVLFFDGTISEIKETGGIALKINQQKKVLFILARDYSLELYDIIE